MATIQIKRGLQEGVERLTLAEGELALALDTGNVYIGTTAGKVHINPPGGTADEAVKLKRAREFSASGDVTAPVVAFNGTQNVQLALTLATMARLTAGTYTKLTVDAKGREGGKRAGGGVRDTQRERHRRRDILINRRRRLCQESCNSSEGKRRT